MVDCGIVERRRDLREIQPTLAYEVLALLELDAADVFAGGDVHLAVEERRQMRGADAGLARDALDAHLVINVRGDVLQRAADDQVLVALGDGRFQLLPAAAVVAQQAEQL